MMRTLTPDDHKLTVDWINAQAEIQHQNNHKWWIDLETGKRLDRNKGELLALIHSEISEAWTGLYYFDDKLPQYNGAQVEIADALIRIFDFMGGFGIVLDADVVKQGKPPVFFEGENPVTGQFNDCHLWVSNLLETYRKDANNPEKIAQQFYDLINNLIWLSAIINEGICAAMIVEAETSKPFPLVPLMTLVNEKSYYNSIRADHKTEVRKAEGGKKF